MTDGRITLPGIIAATLLFFATGWGLLLALICLPFYSWDQLLICTVVLGPGYLMTVGYGYRTFTFPSLVVRQQLWIASIVVQGLWLLIVGVSSEMNAASFWWGFATVASVIGLIAEPVEAHWRVRDQELQSKESPADG